MCNDGIINVFIMQADSPAAAPVHQHQPSPTNTSPQWFLAWDGTGRNIIITAFCFMLTFCAHFVRVWMLDLCSPPKRQFEIPLILINDSDLPIFKNPHFWMCYGDLEVFQWKKMNNAYFVFRKSYFHFHRIQPNDDYKVIISKTYCRIHE